MHKLLALVAFVFALYGCDLGGSTMVYRSSENGRDTLHSRIRLRAGSTHFDCLASASGRCHYTLFAERCANAAGAAGTDCDARPLRRFDVVAGQTRDVAGLPDFTPCVRLDATAVGRDCARVRAGAAR